MTVQVDRQPVTDQITMYTDMCYINNSISCLEKKTTVRNTCSDMSLHVLNLLRKKFTHHSASPARYLVLFPLIKHLFSESLMQILKVESNKAMKEWAGKYHNAIQHLLTILDKKKYAT